MKDTAFISVWIKRFLLEYLVTTRNLSKNTQLSYRDTFRLLLPFVATNSRKPVDLLLVEDTDPVTVRTFLSDLETQRGCSIATRNQRLSAIHAFGRFVGMHSPEHLEWCRQIQLIPIKRAEHTLITYLEKQEMDALLNAPNRSNRQEQRDYALLLFLYNTGARADEAAQLKIGDLNISGSSKKELTTVLIKGKGNKPRRCPLWQKTVDELRNIIGQRSPLEPVFLNRLRQPITRFGIHNIVRRYVNRVIEQHPQLTLKRVSPHTIRHTTATHLLQAGVDINTIRAWLGHVSINTTNVYAEVNMEMKARALACCEIEGDKTPTHWRNDKGLMSFLENI
ncbi:tyrosine-type recombinase/integrase [Dyadobacter psychrophilus]|uniref:Site-specific recombinase XerD n=1 Tax=Dyadobacter psychrophilus TaxID=651661 RepID=A0A1T5FI77_9BACT|nr:tyrosine-type recombinase/integrase [Dyadobacter psychrophilus]SKB95788.1 Site-specific recombinase XerD [Dyadobacter psychrophilus]